MFEPFFIPDDWTEDDGYTIAMFCVPNSVKWRTAVFSAINLLSFGRTWDAETGNIKNAQEIAEGILVSYMANCNDFFTQMTAALQTLAQVQLTIAQSGNCGCESVGTGLEPTGDEGIPATGPGEPWPDNEEYFDYRCKAAGEIVRRILQSIHILQDYISSGYFNAAVTLVTTAVTSALTAAGLGPLLSQLGWIATVVGALITDNLIDLDEADTVVTANFDDLKCALYEGYTAEDSKANFSEVLDGTALNSATKAFLLLFLTNGVLNWLWNYEEQIAVLPTVYDCSDCGEPLAPCDWMFAPAAMIVQRGFTSVSTAVGGTGTIDNLTETTFTVTSVLGVASGINQYVIGMCTKEFYDRWIEGGAASLPIGAACDCEIGETTANKNLQFIANWPTSASVYARRCDNDGTFKAVGNGQPFIPNPDYGLSFFTLHRNAAAGQFSMDLRVNLP